MFVGIAGNTLEVSPSDSMDKDTPATDVVVYKVSEVTDASAFRLKAREAQPEGGEAAKRAVGDAVEARFDELHAQAEEIRKAAIDRLTDKGVEPHSLNITPPG